MMLRKAWERNAHDWARWARTAAHDHFYWEFNRPRLLELLPPAGRLTLDIGCGEGRLARELMTRGHRVLAIDGSPSLACLAQQATPVLKVLVGDAARLPLADQTADLAVACMSLQDIDDLPKAVSEIGRVLMPGGRFCFAVIHPLNSLKAIQPAGYFTPTLYSQTIERDGLRMQFNSMHHPLERYFHAVEEAGLLVEAVREPVPTEEHVIRTPQMRAWTRMPCFLHVRALKPSQR
jgi:ubiquinone/menaquinone biosynthesis C-methylase UbiE